jgi:hypothetical protein
VYDVRMAHLRRSDWEIGTCSQVEAREFIERTHYAGGSPNTAVYRHVLRPADEEKIMGVALWLPPTRVAAESVNRENPWGVLALSRLCVADEMPTNSASFLLGASMRLIDRKTWPTLLTYADTRLGHTGAIYKATNWTCLGEVKGWPAWRHKETGEMRGKKRGPRNYSTDEMVEMGFERLSPMPKIKYVHHA